jgi:ribosome-associated heat shock protein Hsp15
MPNDAPGLDATSLDRQRVDKWLWHARVVRTRSAAAALATAGHVRINGARIDAPSRPVRAGDVVTVALDRAVRVLKVVGFAERRGSADDARLLCESIEPAGVRKVAPVAPPAVREAGAGRPTKWERRAIDRFTGEAEGEG